MNQLFRKSLLSYKSSSLPPTKEAVIVSLARTPIGSYGGALSKLPATVLGGIAIRGTLERAPIVDLQLIEEVYMGNVCSANIGQAPARQAAISAGLPYSVVCTTINKVCSSGMKSIILATQSIMLGHRSIMIAGGMESMSNVPYYVEKSKSTYVSGHQTMFDGVLKDGLWDVYYQQPMGLCAEETAKKYQITRDQQDAYCIESYRRTALATERGWFKREIVPVSIPQGKDQEKLVISEDEEFKRIRMEKVPTLRPVFKSDGTITAANSSKLSDGASAMLIMSSEKSRLLGLRPMARVLGFADFEQDPKEFATSPALAIPYALNMAGISLEHVSRFEINEAFAVVALANRNILNIDPLKLNVAGGAVALGHPIGSSGCRITGTLINLLEPGQYGCASICNGGGGASALVVQRL